MCCALAARLLVRISNGTSCKPLYYQRDDSQILTNPLVESLWSNKTITQIAPCVKATNALCERRILVTAVAITRLTAMLIEQMQSLKTKTF